MVFISHKKVEIKPSEGNMFCVECGKEGKIYKDGICIDCYIKTHNFSKGPQLIDLSICGHCGSYKYKNTWTSDLFDEVLRRMIKNVFYINNELKKVNITTECKEKKEETACKVVISGILDDVEITEEHEILIRMSKTVCDVCSKRFGGYHEAVLQIRADKRKPTKDELDNIRLDVASLVESLRAKGNRSLFITDMGKEHGGFDFYLSDKGATLTIAKKIQEQFGGEMKQSSKNVGMKDSRQIYKMTYLLRLPAYRKGDFISHKNSFFYISSIKGNKVHVFELSNWGKRVFDSKELQKANILGGKELIKEMIFVSQSKDEVQFMDPETYEIKFVRKPRPISLDSEKITIVKIKDQVFLLPEKDT